MWSRIHLIPLLTAEEDRDLVRRHLADQAREKELMGSATSAYNSDRYVSSPSLLGNLGWNILMVVTLQIRTAYVRCYAFAKIEINCEEIKELGFEIEGEDG